MNPVQATGFFPYPMKTSQNHWFSNVFRGVEKKTSGMIWVNQHQVCMLYHAKHWKYDRNIK